MLFVTVELAKRWKLCVARNWAVRNLRSLMECPRGAKRPEPGELNWPNGTSCLRCRYPSSHGSSLECNKKRSFSASLTSAYPSVSARCCPCGYMFHSGVTLLAAIVKWRRKTTKLTSSGPAGASCQIGRCSHQANRKLLTCLQFRSSLPEKSWPCGGLCLWAASQACLTRRYPIAGSSAKACSFNRVLLN